MRVARTYSLLFFQWREKFLCVIVQKSAGATLYLLFKVGEEKWRFSKWVSSIIAALFFFFASQSRSTEFSSFFFLRWSKSRSKFYFFTCTNPSLSTTHPLIPHHPPIHPSLYELILPSLYPLHPPVEQNLSKKIHSIKSNYKTNSQSFKQTHKTKL